MCCRGASVARVINISRVAGCTSMPLFSIFFFFGGLEISADNRSADNWILSVHIIIIYRIVGTYQNLQQSMIMYFIQLIIQKLITLLFNNNSILNTISDALKKWNQRNFVHLFKSIPLCNILIIFIVQLSSSCRSLAWVRLDHPKNCQNNVSHNVCEINERHEQTNIND